MPVLNFSFLKYGGDGIGKIGQAACAGNNDILSAPAAKPVWLRILRFRFRPTCAPNAILAVKIHIGGKIKRLFEQIKMQVSQDISVMQSEYPPQPIS